jgi:hypothetical protein
MRIFSFFIGNEPNPGPPLYANSFRTVSSCNFSARRA